MLCWPPQLPLPLRFTDPFSCTPAFSPQAADFGVKPLKCGCCLQLWSDTDYRNGRAAWQSSAPKNRQQPEIIPAAPQITKCQPRLKARRSLWQLRQQQREQERGSRSLLPHTPHGRGFSVVLHTAAGRRVNQSQGEHGPRPGLPEHQDLAPAKSETRGDHFLNFFLKQPFILRVCVP